MTKETGPGPTDLFMTQLIEKMEEEPERHLYEVHCFFGEMERKVDAGEPIPKSEVEVARKLRDLLGVFLETGKHLWAWDLIEKKARDDKHCQWLLEEKKKFDRKTGEEKREWARSLADYYWEKLNKIGPNKINRLDKALVEIPEDTTDVKESATLIKAQIVQRQLDIIELAGKDNFEPDQIFELRLKILCLLEDLGWLAGFSGISSIKKI